MIVAKAPEPTVAYGDESGMLECYVESPLRSGWPAGDEYNGIITIPELLKVELNILPGFCIFFFGYSVQVTVKVSELLFRVSV